MSKLLKVFIILSTIFIILLNCTNVFAAVDMNLSNNTINNSSTSNSSSNSTTTTFSSVGTSSFDIQLNNILNVSIIVIGVLLILLGIAILIRLKSKN